MSLSPRHDFQGANASLPSRRMSRLPCRRADRSLGFPVHNYNEPITPIIRISLERCVQHHLSRNAHLVRRNATLEEVRQFLDVLKVHE